MKHFYAFLLLLLLGNFGFSQTIYDANFTTTGGFDHSTDNPPADGPQTFDGGNYIIGYDTAPSTDSSGNYFRSNGSILESADFGGAAYFETEPIDISGQSSISIAAIASTIGSSVFNGSGEHFTWSYIIDSGTPVSGATITSDGSLNSPSSWTNIAVSGNSLVVRFDFNINGAGDGFEVTQVEVTSATSISYDTDSEANDPGAQPVATTISSLDDTIAEAVEVFNLDLYDYGTSDGIATEVTTIRLYPYTTNTADWTDNIQGVTVSDGSAITISSVTIDDAFIDISFTSGDLTIPDGDILQVTVSIYLNTSNLADGEILSFMVDADNHGFVADVAGSTFAATFTGGDFNSNDFTIDVEATQLTYLAQATDVEINTIMSPSVEIAYSDANGNIDVDYSGTGFDIVLTSDGSLDATATTTAEATNGIAIFSNLIFDTVATDIKLSATDNSESISGIFESDLFDVTSVSTATGNIMITEIMQNPAGVTDDNGEYFEVYNTTNSPIDMNGWTISDNDSDNHTISSSLIVPAFGFAVLGINSDPLTNGGVTVDYEYSSIALANGDDEVILTDASSTEIDRVEYDGGTIWPDPTGASMVYLGSDIEDNNDGTLWGTATIAEGIDTDFGSPGINGEDQIVAYLVFDNNAWSSAPTSSTGIRIGLIKSDESTSFTTDIALDILYIKEGADLSINEGNTLTLNSLILESTSNSYSSLLLDGTIIGSVSYKRHVNTFNSTTGSTNGQNDLISAPVTNSSQNFGTFRSINLNIPSGTVGGSTTTYYLFGPYDNNAATSPYTLFSDADDATVITAGTGYRTASTDTSTFTFTGDVLTETVTVTITTGSETAWNLIGNPYPSYINSGDFLTINAGNLDQDAVGIYGYDGDAANGWTVINYNNLNTSTNLTPGQGFMVLSEAPTATLNFTPDMRTISGGDDFIAGRTLDTNAYFSLKIANNTTEYTTEFYFNNNSTRSLDPGYDAAIFASQLPDLYIYSHLVENNMGTKMTMQSLSDTDLSDVTIPLGVNANQLDQITFSINESNLPSTVEVYLEDNVENTFTLLTTGDYTITPNNNLDGTGRFYLRFTTMALSNNENTLDNLNIYNDQNQKTIVISGQLLSSTAANLYDIQGRLVSTSILNNTKDRSHAIDVKNLSTGVYVVELINESQYKTQKIILR